MRRMRTELPRGSAGRQSGHGVRGRGNNELVYARRTVLRVRGRRVLLRRENNMEQSKVEDALSYFDAGFNCSQSVLAAYCEDFGLDLETALLVASGFGAGMGRLQETCGAVTGAFMVIGLKYGFNQKEDKAGKERAYAMVQKFAALFEERNKTIKCIDLIGEDMRHGDLMKAMGRVKEVCPKLVKDAAEILETIMAE